MICKEVVHISLEGENYFMRFVRNLSKVLLTAMLLSLFAGCSGTGAGQSQAASAPASSEASGVTGSVRILAAVTGGKDDAGMKKFQEALSKATGLDVQIEKPASDYDQVMMQKLQGGEKYDLIYMSASQYMNLVQQGALLDITDRVKNSKILSENVDPQEWKDITIDGKVYAGFNKKEIHRVVALNNVQLKAAGVDYKSIEPTLEGYYDVFKKLRGSNGEKDYYPFNAVMSESYDLQPWMASLGLKDGVVTDKDGKTYSPYSTDAAAPVWEWFKKLYDEKLMDPASFVDKTKDLRNKMGASSQKTGVCVDWAMWVGLHNANAAAEKIPEDKFQVVSLPGCKTPDGNYMLVKGDASLFGVPANAPNPDGAVKVLEYFATQEGGELLSVGVEGYDYNKEGDKYVLTDVGEKAGGDHGAPVPIYKDFKNPVGYNPGVDEALSYGKYSTIDQVIPDMDTYKKTVGKWGIQIITGKISTKDGLAQMRSELVSLGITQK